MHQFRQDHMPPANRSSNHNHHSSSSLVTVYDLLQFFDHNNHHKPMTTIRHNETTAVKPIRIPICYTMPRIWMSAIENMNETSPEAISNQEWIQYYIPQRYRYVKTIRFYHIIRKHTIRYRLGKVMIRLSEFRTYYQTTEKINHDNHDVKDNNRKL